MAPFHIPSVNQRCKYPTDINELRRRWSVTREAMEKEGVDALFLAVFNPLFAGMYKYLSGLTVPLYPAVGIFSRDPEQGMAVIGHGVWNGKRYPKSVCHEGITDNITVPYLPSLTFSDDFLGVEAVKIAKRNGYKKIGFYNMSTISAAYYNYVVGNLPGVEVVDFSETLDYIKGVKSEYEKQLYTDAVLIHEKLMAAVPSLIRPGEQTEKELADAITKLALDLDCEAFNIMVGADPVKPELHNYLYQNHPIQNGDAIQLLIEVAVPSGLWAESGRIFSIGDPDPRLQKAYDDSMYLQKVFAEKSKPGVVSGALQPELNALLAEMGYLPEERIFAHGQTYDIVDRPCYMREDTMVLKEDMFVAIHPTCATAETSCYVCDNYFITENGGVRPGKLPQEIVIL